MIPGQLPSFWKSLVLGLNMCSDSLWPSWGKNPDKAWEREAGTAV